MSTNSIPIGPIAQMWAGDNTSSDPLILVNSERTRGTAIKHVLPQAYSLALGKSRQVGNETIAFRLTFYGYDDQVLRFPMGQSFESGSVNRDDPSTFAVYTVLLLMQDPNDTGSFLFMDIETDKTYDTDRLKQKPTELPVDFHYEKRDRTGTAPVTGSTKIFNQGTYSELEAVFTALSLSGRWPL